LSRWAGIAACAEMKNICSILVGKPEEKITTGRHRRILEDIIKVKMKEIGF
jgi:hypothetical protein